MVLIAQVIAIISLPLAVALLVTSSLFLEDWRGAHENCTLKIELCTILKYYVIGAAFGIGTAALQFAACTTAILQKWHLWCFLHVVVVIGAVIAFSLPMEKGADTLSWYVIKDDRRTRAKAFLVAAGIDFIYSLVAALAVFALDRSGFNASNYR